jgi:ribosomal RNA assembly protein
MKEEIKIPHERISVLIGKGGETKKVIENTMHVTLHVNSKTGNVEIEGEADKVFFAKDVVKAIARGFSPKNALLLKNDNYVFELIDLKDYCRNKNDLVRVRARLIGTKGRIKTSIEEATNSVISIYGWTVGVIAPLDTAQDALHLIHMIIDGAKLSTVLHEAAVRKRERNMHLWV